MQELKILQGAEPFTFGEGPTAALLIHGFTGSPQSMRDLGKYLAEAGIAVTCPRLPGHGTTWQDLNTRTTDEWVATVNAELDRLRDEHDEIFLVGLSGGGALALDCAARRPKDVAGLVTLAGSVHSNDPRRFFAPAIRHLVKSLPGIGNDICDPDAREICYERIPTSAAHSLLRFMKRVRGELPKVINPILVLHGCNDHTVHPGNARLIYEGVSSQDKELVWLERSYHVITLDYDRDEVFERTLGFIRSRARAGRPT